MRRGYLTEPIRGAVAGGAFAGLVGLAVLSLHCPVSNAPHVLAWHLPVVLVGVAGGAISGWVAARFGA